jgi:hypothetical protein
LALRKKAQYVVVIGWIFLFKFCQICPWWPSWKICCSHYICRNPSLGFATKAKGLQDCGSRGKPRSHTACSRECRKVWRNEPSHSQGNSHFGRWSPSGLPNF